MATNEKRCRFGKDKYRDWEKGLPDGILDMIVERLDFIHCLTFSKVCKSWRSVVRYASIRNPLRGCPWLVTVSPKPADGAERVSFCSMTEMKGRCMEISGRGNVVYMCGSVQDWLIVKTQLHSCNKVLWALLNPFTGAKVFLPALRLPGNKLVLSGSPFESNCVYMTLTKPSLKFSLWTKGAPIWTEVEVRYEIKQEPEPLTDAAFCNGNFYFLTKNYNIQRLDAAYASSAIRRRSTSEIKTSFYRVEMPCWPKGQFFKYLMESSGDILLVIRFFRYVITCSFTIYRLDIGRKEWVKLDDLGDQILFLGKTTSRSYSAKELGFVRGNCIFFTDVYRYNRYKSETNFLDWGIFCLDDKRFGSFFYPSKECSSEPVWITAPLWWYLFGERPLYETKINLNPGVIWYR
ncbi:F-box protein [Tripterygium wilfordii]|uniref:F-box protein n=1 Tax=Tripterygium wilfordii TaxID=458696 RepID=A0A7J7DTW0_TRIWF|nr:uncharacterized protein LOC119997507 [Tripterygium wilfordii]KAF5749566.1 F-box protein [Tripterygium wilfordii]